MADTVLVYVTVPNEESGVRIARTLVEERLVACVNIVPRVRSIYRWQGRVEDEEEYLLLMKTRAEAFAPLKERVVALHPYEIPCITALPVIDGHAPYLSWVREEVDVP